jgi:hypothetical protein
MIKNLITKRLPSHVFKGKQNPFALVAFAPGKEGPGLNTARVQGFIGIYSNAVVYNRLNIRINMHCLCVKKAK